MVYYLEKPLFLRAFSHFVYKNIILLVTSYSKLNTDICQMNDTISLYAVLSEKTKKEFGVLTSEQQ